MTYFMVVYLFINGAWVSGDTVTGYGALRYRSEQACLESKMRAEEIQKDLKLKNPSAYDKRFACEPREVKK